MNLLFETPWWLPVTFIGVGLFVWYTGNQRQEKQVMRGGVGIALLGVLIMVISILVDTDREKAVKRTRQIVAAVNDHDWNKFQSLIDPQTTIYGLRGPSEITKAAEAAANRVNLSSARITGVESEQHASLIVISIRILSEQFRGNPAPTDWQFKYENFGNGFTLGEIRLIGDQGRVSEDVIRANLQRLRD